MIPLQVYVENFLSYREGQTIPFDGASLWVLAGANGAGKSTIFDAITFALYGVHRAGKQNVKDLINHQADSFIVEFDFLVAGEEYRVRRTVSRRGRSTREVFRLSPSKEPVPDTDSDSGFNRWVENTIGLNEEAFTSCVLLLQGQSDKLLSAKPTERYEILKQLIDLSAYERLYEKANSLRQECAGQVTGFKSQIDLLSSISEEELQTARERLNEAEKNWQTIQKKVDALTILVEQSKQWEQLQIQIRQQQESLKEFQDLIEQSDQINQKFARFQELERVLPLLKKVFEQRKRFIATERQIESLEEKSQQLQNNLGEEESKKNQADQKVEELAKNIEELQNQSTILANRLLELAPIVEKLSQFELIQEKLNECDRKLANFPSDLNRLVRQAEEQDKLLAELEKALPWLKQLAQFRSNLADALKREQAASDRLKSLDIELQEHQDRVKKLSADLETSRKNERNLSQEVTRAQTNYDAVCRQRDRFEEAAHLPTCELCGQEITPEHVQKEKQRLEQQIATAKTALDNLNLEYKKAENYLSKLEGDFKVFERQLTSLQEERNQAENQNKQAQRDAKSYVSNLKNAFENLTLTYQVLVSPYDIKTPLEWLDTTYPTETDLEDLKQKVINREKQTKILQELRQQLDECKKLDSERQTYCKQLDEIENNVSLAEAKQARIQQPNLQQAKEQIDSQLQEQKKEQEREKIQGKNIGQTVTQLLDKLQQYQKELGENRVLQDEIQRSLQSCIESLPEIWQEEATTIEADELQELEQQRSQLFEYETLAKKLSNASQSVTHIAGQISTLRTQIEQLPQDAQHPTHENEQKLEQAKTQREAFDVTRKNAEKEFNQLLEQRERRQKLEQDLKKAERECHLYELLSGFLSKKGIQIHILRRAERAIVEIANEILDSLSRGRMRLELRGNGEESGSQSDKALDLVAYNYDTGERPTAVALTSGSQRFRIAVSLALAIGQYAGQGARHIESVIIDEGFGSLDKNGRDDMIQELNELQRRLARIILVSHQEEFFSAFPNGYAVELVNGASRVSLMESDRF